ncbi:DUF6545 domain-containing protein [Rhodococcus jostii]
MALLFIAVGTGALAPVVTILTLQRLTELVTPGLRQAAFWISIARLILVPLGCVIAALEPVRIALLQHSRYRRLHPLWHTLRHATPELELLSEFPEPTNSSSNSWRKLHRRVVRINDSIHHLHQSRATPELLNTAAGFAAERPDDQTRASIEIACWLEVTRRMALADSPKSYCQLQDSPLGGDYVEPHPGHSTSSAETRRLLSLHRALRSKGVQDFATKFGKTQGAHQQ